MSSGEIAEEYRRSKRRRSRLRRKTRRKRRRKREWGGGTWRTEVGGRGEREGETRVQTKNVKDISKHDGWPLSKFLLQLFQHPPPLPPLPFHPSPTPPTQPSGSPTHPCYMVLSYPSLQRNLNRSPAAATYSSTQPQMTIIIICITYNTTKSHHTIWYYGMGVISYNTISQSCK